MIFPPRPEIRASFLLSLDKAETVEKKCQEKLSEDRNFEFRRSKVDKSERQQEGKAEIVRKGRGQQVKKVMSDNIWEKRSGQALNPLSKVRARPEPARLRVTFICR